MNKIYPYAGFWKRALAFFIDSLVLSIPMTIVYALILVPLGMAFARVVSNNPEPSHDIIMSLMIRYFFSMGLIWLLTIVGGWLYFTLMESSKHQATLGKKALGIKVTGAQGERISFARATGRFFGKMISGMTLYFGFYMAGFTQKRQALHDLLANTFVIDKKYQDEGKELSPIPFSKGGCVASIVVALAPFLLYFCMIFLVVLTGISSGINENEKHIVQKQSTTITQQAQP